MEVRLERGEALLHVYSDMGLSAIQAACFTIHYLLLLFVVRHGLVCVWKEG